MGHEVAVSAKRYVKRLCSFAGETHWKRSKCKVKTWQWDASAAKVRELELKVGLLTDKAGSVSERQRELDALEKDLGSTKRAQLEKKDDEKGKAQEFG